MHYANLYEIVFVLDYVRGHVLWQLNLLTSNLEFQVVAHAYYSNRLLRLYSTYTIFMNN